MKQLSLNNLGVQELDAREMVETDGGAGPLIWFIFGLLVSEALDTDAPSDFWDGYNSARGK
jgi:hypothetical protein